MKIIRHPWAPRVGAVVALARRPLGLGLGVALGVLVGCINVQSVFTCLEDQDCIDEGGAGGVCEPNNLCTFPDAACPSGKRWHGRAAELADKCFEPSDLGGATETGAATEASTGGSESDGGTSGPGTSTTLPADDTADSSSSGAPPLTDDGGSSSSGGMTGTCDAVFGTAAGYMLCEETPDNCSFNVMLAMTSCDALCMSFGSLCIEGFTNAATGCVTDGPLACDDATTNESVCRCAKP